MINYEYQEQEEDNSMDLVSFRNRLAKRSGITHHEVGYIVIISTSIDIFVFQE